MKMEVKPALAIPEGLEVTGIEMIDEVLTITAVSTQIQPCCPLCGTPALRVHSRYTRQIRDLPWSGQQVCLLVQVRKCFCKVPDCTRKIFMERLTPFAQPWARVTRRLYQIVQILGLATGGRLGVRVTDRLGIEITRHTILRRIMALPTDPVGQVSQIGIDDFSFRRGRKFGTIVVDLQTHKMLDVLPDRTADTSATWMAAHPELEMVSRDRGGDYAAAARKSAPHATQIADRFHIVKNLSEAVELTLAHCRAEFLQALYPKKEEEHIPSEKGALSLSDEWRLIPDATAQAASLAKRAEKYDRYQQVIELHAQGLKEKEIARRLDTSVRTVQRWLGQGSFPERKPHRKHSNSFDPYISYILSRLQEGCQNRMQLGRELRERGYKGSVRTVYRYVEALQQRKRHVHPDMVPQSPLQHFSSKEFVWLFMRSPDDLDENERKDLSALCQGSLKAHHLYQLVQDFKKMVHQRLGRRLDAWLEEVRESPFPQLHRFVIGVERDKAAVVAGLTLPQSNGLVEGKVNKLKLIKRMGYGRAGFALLRQRVLHAL